MDGALRCLVIGFRKYLPLPLRLNRNLNLDISHNLVYYLFFGNKGLIVYCETESIAQKPILFSDKNITELAINTVL